MRIRRPPSTFFTLLVVAGLQASTAALPRPGLGPCSPVLDTSGLISLQTDCTWTAQAAVGSQQSVRIAATRVRDVQAGTVSLFAAAGSPPTPDPVGVSPGMQLQLERLVLVGFTYAGPGATEPVLWPLGLLQQAGTVLKLTDVRLVTNDQATFNLWLHTFTKDGGTMYWTDNSTILHIHHWTDGKTTLHSVGLLLETATLQNSLQLPSPHIRNCILGATNSTLVPTLLTNAAVVTPQPLLVYLTTNVSLGAFPKLPAIGVSVNRPVVFVGLQSLVTSIDFQMAVNQLNETGSKYSNVTFVGVVLENLAPGDALTTALAPPFSIAISNNVWAAYYNRSDANNTRLAYCNATLVVAGESEMAYVTYMFTMYTSPLPYLRKQTTFYSDVMHMSILQFEPGPGSKAITVLRLKSWYSAWNNVVLTAEPVVAKPMEVPVRLVAVSTGKTSPLVQSVDSEQSLREAGEGPALGNREHILLVLNNISLAAPGGGSSSDNSSDPIRLQSDMSWVGTSPAEQAADALLQQQQPQPAVPVYISFGYVQSVVVVAQPVSDLGLQIRQLMLGQLPQGPKVAAAVAARGPRAPKELWTLLLWSIDRPMTGKGLNLDGVQLQLPRPELAYLQAAAQQSGDFVVELDGDKSTALTFQGVSCIGNGCSSIHVSSFQGPGVVGTNLTLDLDPAAETSIAGYIWPDTSAMPAPVHKSKLDPWAVAVIVVCAVLAAALAAGGFMFWRYRRAARSQALLDPFSKMEFGNSLACSCRQQSADSQHLGRKTSRCSRSGSVETSAVSCTNCEVCHMKANGSCATVDSVSDLGGLGKSAAIATAADSCGAIDQGAVVVPMANLDHAVKQMQQLAGAAAQQRQYQQESDVSAAKESSVPGQGTETYADRVAVGMQRWRAAVSSTTIRLMERRMDAAGHPGSGSSGSFNRMGSSGPQPEGPANNLHLQPSEQLQQQLEQQKFSPTAGPQLAVTVAGSTAPQLQLTELLGQGSFGNVYLGVWRGKQVAVKIMQLPANALLGPVDDCPFSPDAQHENSTSQGGALQGRQRMKRQQRNSCPHMAIMETVVSSTMSHPNVVQVYTYMLNPLTRDASTCDASSRGDSASAGATGPKDPDNIAGWELRIIMEYCNEGSLRDALDCGLLCQPGSYLAPSAVLRTAHDVAAAMMHLHSEGIVHGDLKAGNVMLISSGSKGEGTRVWTSAESRRFTAKVADFGLAMPLGPSDTHATLMARGTPTHMSPELFISGHVSKASDVYAYGILLFEIITGQRAYAGVPVPLLPHEVARQGLRPTWPDSLPSGCKDLRKLAEACWAAKPQDRPTFGGILAVLDHWASGGLGWPAAPEQPSRSSSSDTPSHGAQQQQQQQPAACDPQGPQSDQMPTDVAQQLHTPILQTPKMSPARDHPAGSPAPSSGAGSSEDQQQQHLSPQQSSQKQQQGLQNSDFGAVAPASDEAGAPSRQLSGGQRNRNMDWSEVG